MLKKLVIIVMLIVSSITPLSLSYAEEYTSITLDERVTGSIGESGYYGHTPYQVEVVEEGLLTIDSKLTTGAYEVQISHNNHSFIDLIPVKDNITAQYAVQPGTYYIIVRAATGVTYDFNVSFKAGKHVDVESNDTVNEGRNIGVKQLVQGFDNFQKSNKDVYLITNEKDQRLQLTQKNAKVALYRLDGSYIFSHDESVLSHEINLKKGQYYIEVIGHQYELQYDWKTLQASAEIEPNNSIAEANVINVNRTYTGKIGGDTNFVDYFTFTTAADGLVELKMNDISQTIRLNDANGKTVWTGFYRDDFKIGLPKGQYTLRIGRNNGIKGDYTLQWLFTEKQSISLEPNNSIEAAQPIPLNSTIEKLTTIPGSNNFFKIDVPRAGSLNVKTSHQDVGIALFDADGNWVELYDELFHHTINVTQGTYYIKMSTYSYPRSFTTTFTPHAVEVEPNNTTDTATSLPMNVKTRGYLVAGNVSDLYGLTVSKKGVYNITVDKQKGFMARMIVTNESGKELYDSVNQSSSVQLLLDQGRYFVEVNSSSAAIYDLIWSKETPVLFKDVPANHRYIQEISEMNELGIINGYGDGSFKPNDAIKRHHVAAMIVRAKAPAVPLGLSYKFFFKDVARTHSNFESIHLLVEGGIIDANPNGFKPNNTITRAQMAKMIVKAYNLTLKEGTTPQTFKDVAEDAWYKEYVEILASHGITTGSNGYFNPNDSLSRQHFSVFLHRTIQQS